jgi:hypothetical protein
MSPPGRRDPATQNDPIEAAARGAHSERRVFDAIRAEMPRWIFGIRGATREEDHAGIDLIVETDIGEMGFQVKSSGGGRSDWRRKHPEIARKIAFVTIHKYETEADLRGRALFELMKLRLAAMRPWIARARVSVPEPRFARLAPPATQRLRVSLGEMIAARGAAPLLGETR